MIKQDQFGVILITHYQRILDYIKPTHVHIMIDGKIVLTGGQELIEKLINQDMNGLKKNLALILSTKRQINDSIFR